MLMINNLKFSFLIINKKNEIKFTINFIYKKWILKKKLTLFVSAKIRGLEWDTEFNFHKEESVVLKRDLMPFFEEIEDYETCNEINNLYKELTL